MLRLGVGQILTLWLMPAFRSVIVYSKIREGNGQAEALGQQSPWKEGDRAPRSARRRPRLSRRGGRRSQLPLLTRGAGLSTGSLKLLSLLLVPASEGSSRFDVSGGPGAIERLYGRLPYWTCISSLCAMPTCNRGTVLKTKMFIPYLLHDSSCISV
ncbi:hypothetical protein LEMLEM_LOCUS20220 [Lemmus lemmus]